LLRTERELHGILQKKYDIMEYARYVFCVISEFERLLIPSVGVWREIEFEQNNAQQWAFAHCRQFLIQGLAALNPPFQTYWI